MLNASLIQFLSAHKLPRPFTPQLNFRCLTPAAFGLPTTHLGWRRSSTCATSSRRTSEAGCKAWIRYPTDCRMNCGLYCTLALISPEANPQDKDLNVKWFIGQDSQEHRKWGSKSEKESKSREEREQRSRRIPLLPTPNPHTSQSSSQSSSLIQPVIQPVIQPFTLWMQESPLPTFR